MIYWQAWVFNGDGYFFEYLSRQGNIGEGGPCCKMTGSKKL